jgi:hypothetical protein
MSVYGKKAKIRLMCAGDKSEISGDGVRDTDGPVYRSYFRVR